jgi:hypothetical protein
VDTHEDRRTVVFRAATGLNDKEVLMAIRHRDWVEPAHPVILQQLEDLVSLYRLIRDQFQNRFDKVFDATSRQIGFVVTTTLPITVQVAQTGKTAAVAFSAKNLSGTLFEREFTPVFKEMSGKLAEAKVKPGDYNLLVLWYEALKLKLKTDWMEPAHFQRGGIGPEVMEELSLRVPPEVQEPAHWFDGAISLVKEEEVLISAIDEVYPELRLADRIAAGRQQTRFRVPGIREPAHFRHLLGEIVQAGSLGKLSPGIREPAHFRRLAEILEKEETVKLLSDLVAALKKTGM